MYNIGKNARHDVRLFNSMRGITPREGWKHMKHKMQVRALALALALVMLLPMISIPAFATEDTEVISSFTEDFTGKTREEAIVIDQHTAATSKVTTAAKDAETHGDVLQLDAYPTAPYDYYLWDGSNAVPFDDDYDLKEGGTVELISGTAGDIDVPTTPVNAGDQPWTTVSIGGTNYAAVTGEALDAEFAYCGGNVAAPVKLHNTAITGDGDYIVINLDVYLSKNLLLSAGITSRVMVTKADGGEARIELFKLGKSATAGYVDFQRHGDATAAYEGKMPLSLDAWHTLTLKINRTTTVLTAYADGEFVFQSRSSRSNGATSLLGTDSIPLQIKANTMQFEVSRSNAGPDSIGGYVQFDNVGITLEDMGDVTTSYSYDFEDTTLEELTAARMSLSSLAAATLDAQGHGDVLKIRTEPDATVAYYLWKDRNNKWPITGTVTDGLLSGTCAMGTVTDAPIPESDSDTSKKCTVNGTSYTVVTGNYADHVAGMENYMKPLKIKMPQLDEGGDYYRVSFDLYLSADFKATGQAGFTARWLMEGVNGAEARAQLFQIYSDGNTNQVMMRRHGDSNQVGGSAANLNREQWYRIDILIDRYSTRQSVAVDGQVKFEVMSNKSGQKPTSELLGTGAIPLVAKGSELQFENGRATQYICGGYVEIDNLEVSITDDVVARDFEDSAVGATAHGMVTQSTSKPIEGSAILDDYGSKAWTIPSTGNDRSQYLSTPLLSWASGQKLVLEKDYFFEADAVGQIQMQFQSFSAKGNGGDRVSGTWLDLYQIQFGGNGNATFKFENAGATRGVAGAEILQQTLSLTTGRWHNVALVIDLTGGLYDVYIDGNLAFENVPMYRSISSVLYRLTEVEVALNAITIGKTNKVTGSGRFAIDNIRLFSGDAPSAVAENRNATDFEAFEYSVGKHAGAQKLPSLATIETVSGSNLALRIDMAPASGDGYVLMQASGSGAAKEILNGAFVWNLEDKTQATLDGEAITLVQNGEHYEYTVDDVTYRAVSAAVAGASIGDANVCVPTKRIHDVFSYASTKTVVLEADYFIEAGSTGIIESQIESFYYGGEAMTSGTYMNLYKIYLETGRLDNGLSMKIGEWNSVKVILDLETGAFEIYLNGVFSHAKTQADEAMVNITFGGDVAHSWSLAKVYRQVDMNAIPYVGGILIDNVSVGTELPEVSETFGDRFLSDEAFLTFANESLMQIVDGASIRLKEDGTGLRFATLVDEAALTEMIGARLAEGTTVEIGKRGTLIAPAAYYRAAGAFTHADLEALPVSTKYVDVAFGGHYFGGDAGVKLPEGNYMVGSLIKLKDYNREFAAAGYIELIVDGTSYLLYTDVVVRSAAEVASKALADESVEWSEDHKAILESFAGIAGA